MADNITVTDAEGTLSSGDGTNYALNAFDSIGATKQLTINPPVGKSHPNFTLVAVDASTLESTNAVGFSSSVNGTYSSDGTFFIGAFNTPVIVYIKRLTNAATKLLRTYEGFIIPNTLSGVASSTSSATGNVVEVAPVAGTAISTSQAVGDVSVYSDVNEIVGIAQSTSAAIGNVIEVAPVSGAAVSNSLAVGNVTAVGSGSPHTLYATSSTRNNNNKTGYALDESSSGTDTSLQLVHDEDVYMESFDPQETLKASLFKVSSSGTETLLGSNTVTEPNAYNVGTIEMDTTISSTASLADRTLGSTDCLVLRIETWGTGGHTTIRDLITDDGSKVIGTETMTIHMRFSGTGAMVDEYGWWIGNLHVGSATTTHITNIYW